MCPDELNKVAPGADDIIDTRTVRLEDFRFVFNKRSNDGTAKANVISYQYDCVWGAIYYSSPQVVVAMDKREGRRLGHYSPHPVRVATDAGEQFEASAYLAGKEFIEEGIYPDKNYLQKIVEGAKHCGLPEDYIAMIVETGTVPNGTP
jgi:hypothetical protein